jgi:hypothetical protein
MLQQAVRDVQSPEMAEIWLTKPSVGDKNAYRRRQAKFTVGQPNAVAMESPDG